MKKATLDSIKRTTKLINSLDPIKDAKQIKTIQKKLNKFYERGELEDKLESINFDTMKFVLAQWKKERLNILCEDVRVQRAWSKDFICKRKAIEKIVTSQTERNKRFAEEKLDMSVYTNHMSKLSSIVQGALSHGVFYETYLDKRLDTEVAVRYEDYIKPIALQIGFNWQPTVTELKMDNDITKYFVHIEAENGSYDGVITTTLEPISPMLSLFTYKVNNTKFNIDEEDAVNN